MRCFVPLSPPPLSGYGTLSPSFRKLSLLHLPGHGIPTGLLTYLLSIKTVKGPARPLLVSRPLEIVTGPRSQPWIQIKPRRILAWVLISGYWEGAVLSSLRSPRQGDARLLMPMAMTPFPPPSFAHPLTDSSSKGEERATPILTTREGKHSKEIVRKNRDPVL